ncbi:MAG: outer membrane lipoprotein chaperone LolA [Melioribacteraceae bacterium]|nr:outer membrane lipoprotein chaperone LolA [Melioribacteraceae bacterium]MCF8355838.1 outer membrane lipoprotein chaperone LolA [Melioribacteraceae bacterium]MCF8392587.1 outer membrane lipoprotein chaperone LolA [Melioribacteraceae bacterium]MCF8418541.1 outer membrane lipoprotein chaperone LolA [Melioribacteraceae bacterium]
MKKLIAVISLIPIIMFSQGGEEVLKNLQNKFESIENLSANFKQTTYISSVPGSTIQGKFFYKRANKFRAEFPSTVVVSDGDTVWNYNRKLNRVVLTSAEDEAQNFSLDRFVLLYPEHCTVSKLNEQLLEKYQFGIQLIPVEDELMAFKNIKIWTDESYVLHKLSLTDHNDNSYVFLMSEIDLSSKLDDSIFTFNPPKGSQIIDLRY